MFSIGKPILIGIIVTLFYFLFGQWFPKEIPGLTLVEFQSILDAVHAVFQAGINLTASFIDWAFLFLGMQIFTAFFIVFNTTLITMWVISKAEQSQ